MQLIKINQKWVYGSILFLLITLFSCNDNLPKACTEEFRSIIVTIRESDNSIAEIDSYFVVKTANNDTILTMNDTIYQDPFLQGHIVFTDNEMNFTNQTGSTFRFSAYQATEKVVDQLYTIRHDGCHIELISGEVEIILP